MIQMPTVFSACVEWDYAAHKCKRFYHRAELLGRCRGKVILKGLNPDIDSDCKVDLGPPKFAYNLKTSTANITCTGDIDSFGEPHHEPW